MGFNTDQFLRGEMPSTLIGKQPRFKFMLPYYARKVRRFFGWGRAKDTHQWGLPYHAHGSRIVVCGVCRYWKFEEAKLDGEDADCDLVLVKSVQES